MSEINFSGKQWEVSDALQAFYIPYSSYVIKTRALPDCRDGLKTGARFILYAQYKDKLTYKEKRRKAVATVNGAMRYSPHGDSSILGTAVRMSQEFSLRYPVIEVQGNNGSYLSGDDYSQARYLEMRGNEIAWSMTEFLKKDTIDTWKLNYTEEEYYPTVLPTIFPYSLVNGSFGIAVACASSIPPHNIGDVCKAIKTLIKNPEATFEELYCPIDFPTGGTIINEKDVKESLKNGTGKAALVRATIDYVQEENELVVREMPYMTFTNNAIRSINKALDEGLLSGIDNVYDGTDYEGCKIYIKLSKNANVKKVLRLLYKHTILQNSYSINMNMLENGTKPKLFTWKESIQAYIDHVHNVLFKAYTYDLNKLLERIEILNGLIIAFHNIEQLVKDIRSSQDTESAKQKIIENYQLTSPQADAILKMKLSNLTHLEIEKLEREKQEKEEEANIIKNILENEDVFQEKMIEKIENICNKYADERRTRNISLDFTSENEDEAEPIEKRELFIYYTNKENFYTQESTTLLTTHRGGKGTKIKLKDDEAVIKTISDDNYSSLLCFTNKGRMFNLAIDDLPINGRINAGQLFDFDDGEKITAITSISKQKEVQFFTFITKYGIIKKTKADEYFIKRGKSLKAINLKNDDEVINVLFTNNENIGILSHNGNFVRISTEEINPIGRVAAGVRGIKLNENDYVISAEIIKSTDKDLITISKNGLIKKASLKEFPVCSRATKGKKISGFKENDFIVDLLTLSSNCDIIILTNRKTIKINTKDLRQLSREAIGVKAIELDSNDFIVELIQS